MIDALISFLTPIFIKMGASAADVSNYIRSLSGYIYAIVALIGVMAVVMVGAHFVAKKGSRHVVRWNAALAFVLALVLIVNLICYGPMNAIVSGVLNASRAEISDDVVGNSKEVIEDVAEEGIVLVKNNGLLPLSGDVSSLNVFGWASAHPVYSGTGSAASGDGDLSTVSLMEGLHEAGYATNDTLTDMYTAYGRDYWGGERPVINMTSQDWSLPEPTAEYYTDSLMSEAASFSDTAVVVIGRSGGENADLPTDMQAVLRGTYNMAGSELVQQSVAHNYNFTNGVFYNNSLEYDEFDEGEHYLQLSNSEEKLIELVCSRFSKVIVVINANNVMELDWVDNYDSIGAVLLMPGTGTTGLKALGNILNGTVNPSGKTADTYPIDLLGIPALHHSGNSGNHLYTNVGDLTKTLARKDNTFNGVVSFVDYVESIYTGYKFYETAAGEGLIEYASAVKYPFGYGLSYTTFTQEITSFKQDKDTLSVEVTVTNTGDVAGKDVVELYFTPPYYNGGIEKASVNLLDFGKTSLLEPGASETVYISVPLEDLASYDSDGIKVSGGGYILEAGEYTLSIRSDSHTVLDSRTFTLDADVDYSVEGRASDYDTAVNRFDYMESERELLSRKDGFANYEKATAAPTESELELSKDKQNAIKENTFAKYKSEDYDNPEDVMPTTGAKNDLVLSDLTGKDYDDPQWELLLDEMTVEEMNTLINTGGWKTAEIASIGKVATSDCDGPSGLSNYVTGSTGTQFPTEVLMAQTWNKELLEEVGAAMGQEFANASNYGWYGPALNLHRTPFSGRNFEYYSEDAVLSGKLASQEVNGAVQYGVYPYIKHFAANDQETNRTAFLMTCMSEQTFREYCLKPFEIVVKNFDSGNGVLGVMTSYNFIGTKPTCSSYELLTEVLRGEWGFVGTVITDYNGSYGFQMTDAIIRAGGDLMLGYGMAETNQLNLESPSVVLAMRRACHNILYTVGNSGYYTSGETVQSGMSNMDKLFIAVDTGTVLAVLAVDAIVILRWLKKRKQTAAAA